MPSLGMPHAVGLASHGHDGRLGIFAVFLRRVEEGSADKSYGIEVARLAGLPRAVIERAREILQRHEQNEHQLSETLAPPAGATQEGRELRILALDGHRIEGSLSNPGAVGTFSTMALFAPDGRTILTNGNGPPGSTYREIRPGPGRKFRPGSSALIRHWIACPRGATSSPASDPPSATSIWSATMSRPVTISVTVCSTWSRVFISRK